MGLATCPGPDWLKEAIPSLGLRLKVYNELRTVCNECDVTYTIVTVALLHMFAYLQPSLQNSYACPELNSPEIPSSPRGSSCCHHRKCLTGTVYVVNVRWVPQVMSEFKIVIQNCNLAGCIVILLYNYRFLCQVVN